MDILYLLIPLSVLLVLALMGVFAWALNARQFDDLEREGARILDPVADPAGPERLPLDVDQARARSPL
jgi:cbb3-type cytochrome oxidase maturation protein